MPIGQSGENVVFYMSDVQIQYTGDPTRFAWVVPMPAAPEVSVGSQRLIDAILAGTRPTVTVSNGFEACSDGSSTTSDGCGMSAASAGDDSAAFDDTTRNTENVGADDSETQQISAFDVTILEPTVAGEVATWLEDNGFLNAPSRSQSGSGSGSGSSRGFSCAVVTPFSLGQAALSLLVGAAAVARRLGRRRQRRSPARHASLNELKAANHRAAAARSCSRPGPRTWRSVDRWEPGWAAR